MTKSRFAPAAAVLAALALIAACGATPTSPAATDGPMPTPPQPSPAQPSPAPPSPAVPTEQPPTLAPTDPLTVVASTTILADFVRQVGGERVTVSAIIPPGRDVHTFDPAPSDAALLAGADLLVINGVGLDDWLEDIAEETAPGVALVALGENLEGVEYLEGHDHHHDDHDDDHADEHGHDDHDTHDDDHADDHDDRRDDRDHAVNPHLWLDVSNARHYVDRLLTALVALDPDGRAAYEANAAAYDETLADLDEWIRAEMAELPDMNRRVVSFHDAFPYFAHAYDVEIVGVVIESPGQEPSAGEIVRLITDIREAGVRAILTEIQFSDRLAQAIADETGVTVIDDLYTDSLGDPPVDTYEGAMRWNVERIVAGLR